MSIRCKDRRCYLNYFKKDVRSNQFIQFDKNKTSSFIDYRVRIQILSSEQVTGKHALDERVHLWQYNHFYDLCNTKCAKIKFSYTTKVLPQIKDASFNSAYPFRQVSTTILAIFRQNILILAVAVKR